MKRTMEKRLTITVYLVLAIMYIATIWISFQSVSNNLNGWHGFTSTYAVIFVFIAIILLTSCIHIIMSLWANKITIHNYVAGGVLLIFPLFAHVISAILKGNVKTDIQYLILRILQGFEPTYLYLVILSAIGLIILSYLGFKEKDNQDR